MNPGITPYTMIRLGHSDKTRVDCLPVTARLASMAVSCNPKLETTLVASEQYSKQMTDFTDSPNRKAIRQSMVSFIANLIQQRASAFKGSSAARCTAVACVVERHLLKQAESFDEYADKETLETRLRYLLSQLLRRRLQQQAKAGGSQRARPGSSNQPNCNESNMRLKCALGSQFTEAMKVLREIQTLKLRQASMGCASDECRRQVCGRLPLPANMPSPVRSLFFETDLVPAIAQAANLDKCRAATVNWSALIHQAKRNIDSYKEWCESS